MKSHSLFTWRVLSFIAALLILLCPAAHAGKVSVKIVARPAQAAGVAGWSAAMTASATAAIGGRVMAPGATVNDWIGINCGKHHIIPQTYLQAAAGLAIHPEAGDDRLRGRLVTALRAISAGPAGGPPAVWNLGPVVWARINLFEGLTEFYRSDDPGEGAEVERPKSFDFDRWSKLQAARAALDSVGTVQSGSFDSSTDNLNKQQKGSGKTGFTVIVEAFEALAAYPGPVTINPFLESDWIDNGSTSVNLGDLIRFNQSQIQVVVNPAKKNAYHLVPKKK